MNAGVAGRMRTWLFTLAALGEMAMGLLTALFPGAGTWLIGVQLNAAGFVVVRMIGVALLAIGLVRKARGIRPASSIS